MRTGRFLSDIMLQRKDFKADFTKSQTLSSELETIISLVISSNSTRCLPTFSKNSKDYAKLVIGNSTFQELLIETISTSKDQLLLSTVLDKMSLIFPNISEENITSFIDIGLPLSLIIQLESNNEKIILSALSLITSSVSCSEYARDCYINFGFLSILIPLFKFQSLIEPISITLCSFFEYPSLMDFQTIVEFVQPLLELISIVSKPTIKMILSTFYKMYLKCHSIVFTFYKMKIHCLVIEMLSDVSFAREALDLIGALCNAEPVYVKSLLELNLFQKLIDLYNQNYLNSLFWVFSNLIESSFQLFQPIFNFEFCIHSASIALQSSSQVKIEAALFISKVIFFSEKQVISKFIHAWIIELFSNVLNFDDQDAVLFCLHALQRLIQSSISEGNFMVTFKNSDLCFTLEDLSQNELDGISSYSRVLLNFIQ